MTTIRTLSDAVRDAWAPVPAPPAEDLSHHRARGAAREGVGAPDPRGARPGDAELHGEDARGARRRERALPGRADPRGVSVTGAGARPARDGAGDGGGAARGARHGDAARAPRGQRLRPDVLERR